MIAIACISRNMGLGKDNKLLYHIKDDMDRFKRLTNNKAVIMGRKTMESLNYKPLPNRLNIVLTTNYNLYYDGFVFIHSSNELLSYLTDHNLSQDSVLIGGAEIYKELIDDCAYLCLTVVDEFKEADTFFPLLDYNWELLKENTQYIDNKKVIYQIYVNDNYFYPEKVYDSNKNKFSHSINLKIEKGDSYV